MNKRITTIELIGDQLENIYKLGQIDRHNYQNNFNKTKKLLNINNSFVDQITQEAVKSIVQNEIHKNSEFQKKIMAYAQGLEVNPLDIACVYFIPELLASAHIVIPNFLKNTFLGKIYNNLIKSNMKYFFGCSSFITLDENKNIPVHGRILDYPLVQTFEQEERIVKSKFNNQPEIISLSSSGFFYPALTAMTSEGVTFSLHQKPSTGFNANGAPIFEIINQLLIRVDNITDAIKFLKTQTPYTNWGIILSFKNNQILECDITKNGPVYNQYNLKEKEILYFNNHLIDKQINEKKLFPYGLYYYSKMRNLSVQGHIQHYQNLIQTKSAHEKLLYHMCFPRMQQAIKESDIKTKDASTWNLYPLTIASTAISTMSTAGEFSAILGDAPKSLTNDVSYFQNIWKNIDDQITIEIPLSIDNNQNINNKNYINFTQGMHRLAAAQKAIDENDLNLAYHHFQISLQEHFVNTQEHTIYSMFFNALRFIHENDKRTQYTILENFKLLNNKLPLYLQDHAHLFIDRLERILSIDQTVKYSLLKTAPAKITYKIEKKIPDILLHKILSKSIQIKMDICDIIYLHSMPMK